MSLTRIQREELKQLAQEMLSDALLGLNKELTELRDDLDRLKDGLESNKTTAFNNEVSIGKLTSTVGNVQTTVDRVIIILSGDDKIAKDPGLMDRVRNLEKDGRKSSMERGKLIGMGAGALLLWGIVYKISALVLSVWGTTK